MCFLVTVRNGAWNWTAKQLSYSAYLVENLGCCNSYGLGVLEREIGLLVCRVSVRIGALISNCGLLNVFAYWGGYFYF